MNQKILNLLLVGETRFGLLTRALELQDEAKELNTRVHAALDTFNGAVPEAVIPEGYALLPEELPVGTEESKRFAKSMDVDTFTAQRVYRNFIARFRENS